MDNNFALATEILPLFRANTLRGLTRTCGYYAFASGRDADTVGHALHLIGAGCVLACVAVAPIHFVEHLEDEWRGIFAIAASGSIHADAWPLMCAASRLHVYSENDFEQVARVFRAELKSYAEVCETPVGLWRVLVDHALAQAAQRYARIIALNGRADAAWRAPQNASPTGLRASVRSEQYGASDPAASASPLL